MEVALEAGAEDVVTDDEGAIEVPTAPERVRGSQERARAAGLTPEVAEVTMRRQPDRARRRRCRARRSCLDVLEDLDDVQAVYHNAEIGE